MNVFVCFPSYSRISTRSIVLHFWWSKFHGRIKPNEKYVPASVSKLRCEMCFHLCGLDTHTHTIAPCPYILQMYIVDVRISFYFIILPLISFFMCIYVCVCCAKHLPSFFTKWFWHSFSSHITFQNVLCVCAKKCSVRNCLFSTWIYCSCTSYWN